MSNLVSVNIKIRGTRALLWNAFTSEAIPLQKQEKSGVAGNNPEEWRKTVLMTEQRQLYLEPTYIFGSLQPLLISTLQVLDDRILTDRFLPEERELSTDPQQPVYLDVRSIKNPATRARNVRYRIAASPGWTISFGIEWDKTIVSREEMKAVVIDAGRLVGIGDGRTIGFGRFRMEDFVVSQDQ